MSVGRHSVRALARVYVALTGREIVIKIYRLRFCGSSFVSLFVTGVNSVNVLGGVIKVTHVAPLGSIQVGWSTSTAFLTVEH